MAFLVSNIVSDVGLRLLLCPVGSNVVLRSACCSVGIVLPVYSTFKAIEREDENDKQKWLMYWAAYGSFSLVEVFTDKRLSWFPMYYYAKFAFLVWLQLPTVEGAKQLYKNLLRPFLLKHEARVDISGFAYGELVGLRSLLCPVGSNVVLRTACCSVGIVLPVYSTFKAIERENENDKQKWLMYWAAYGSFSLVEVFTDKLLSWFPMYYHSKFAFLVWLQLPTVEGAKQLYKNHLRPFLLKHEATVDIVVGFGYGEMVRLVSRHQAEIDYLKTLFLNILGSAQFSVVPADGMPRGQANGAEGHPQIEGNSQTFTTNSDTEPSTTVDG